MIPRVADRVRRTEPFVPHHPDDPTAARDERDFGGRSGADLAIIGRSRAGATLLELMVALSILAIAAAVAVPAFRQAAEAPPTERDRVSAARREAIDRGRAVTLTLRDSAGVRLLTAYPDGHVAADTAFGLDPANGRRRAEP